MMYHGVLKSWDACMHEYMVAYPFVTSRRLASFQILVRTMYPIVLLFSDLCV